MTFFSENRQVLSLSILGSIAIVLGGALYFFQIQEKNQESIQTNLPARTDLQLQEQVAELIKTKDFARCDEVQDKTYRTVCTNNIALILAEEIGDTTYCAKLDDRLVPRADCERIVMKKSIELENIGICDTAADTQVKEKCISSYSMNLAKKKGDQSLCADLQSETENLACKNNITIEEFFKNKNYAQFDCQKFSGDRAVNDCRIFKEILTNQKPLPGQILEACRNKKTELFATVCHSTMRTATESMLMKE